MEALHAAEAYRAMSLDAPTGEDGPAPAEALGGDDGGFERMEQRLLLPAASQALAPREREILRLRFFEGLTQREIAERVGISQMHVSRLIRRSVDQLRVALDVAAGRCPRCSRGTRVAVAGGDDRPRAGDGRRRLTGTPWAPWRSTPRRTAPRPTPSRRSRSSATASSWSSSTSCASRCRACRSSSASC